MASLFKNILNKAASTVIKVATFGNDPKKIAEKVIPTLTAAVTGKGVSANTGNKGVNTVLSAAASKPFLTAAAITPVGGSLIKSAASKVATSFSNAKLGTQLVVGGGALVVAGAAKESPKTIQAAIKTPSALVNFGSNIGKAVESPSVKTVSAIAKENPVLTAGLATAAAVVAGKALGGVANTIATTQNTRAITNSEAAAAAKNLLAGESIATSSSGKLTKNDAKLNEKIAKLQAENELKLAKYNLKALEMQNDAAVQIAKLQTQTLAAAPTPTAMTPVVAAAPTPKKVTKKKKYKKAKKKKHKYKRRYRGKDGNWRYVY